MKETVHCHCPACGRRTPHMVFRERLLAAVQWCQHCYHVSVQSADEPGSAPVRRADAA